MKALTISLVCILILLGTLPAFTEDNPKLLPGQKITFSFPEMPRTYADLMTNNNKAPMMTVSLPTNYDPKRKHPLLIFLSGGSGSTGANPAVARAITQEKDFISVDLPLFKVDTKDIIIRDDDCRLMWPLYIRMLAKLTETIPNIDLEHRILGGFSNGAHAVGGLLDTSEGAVASWFTGFFIIEGGGRTQRYDLIASKTLLIGYGKLNGDVTRNRSRSLAQ